MQPVNAGSRTADKQFRSVLRFLFGYKWSILVIMICAVCVGLFVGWLKNSSAYSAGMRLQVNSRLTTGIGFDDVARTISPSGTTTRSERDILRSAPVLSKVIEQLNFDVYIQPQYFPVVGKAIARDYSGIKPAAPWFGLSEYSWGGESIKVGDFVVSDDLRGFPFAIQALPGQKYKLYPLQDPDNFFVGKVGEVETTAYLDFPITIAIDSIRANEGSVFTLIKLPIENAVEALRAQIVVSERGDKHTGILDVNVTARRPARAIQIRDLLGASYIMYNAERKLKIATEGIAFIEAELPELKRTLDQANDAYVAYKEQNGITDVTSELSATLAALENNKELMVSLDSDYQELVQKYRPDHPEMQAWRRRFENAKVERDRIASVLSNLSIHEQEILRLEEQRRNASDRYAELVANMERLRILTNKGVMDVSIIDRRAPTILASSGSNTFFVMVFLGAGLAFGQAFIRRKLKPSFQDTELIEGLLDSKIRLSLPLVTKEQEFSSAGSKTLLDFSVNTPATQAFRALAVDTMLWAEQGGTSILVTSPGPAAGKTFVASNMAKMLADTGKKVLLIDTDCYQGRVHDVFNMDRANGFVNLHMGQIPVDALLSQAVTVAENLDVISKGLSPKDNLHILPNKLKVAALIEQAKEHYEFVILDSAPVLAIAETSIYANVADNVVVVLQCGKTSMTEADATMNSLSEQTDKEMYVVINGVQKQFNPYEKSALAYRYKYYQSA